MLKLEETEMQKFMESFPCSWMLLIQEIPSTDQHLGLGLGIGLDQN